MGGSPLRRGRGSRPLAAARGPRRRTGAGSGGGGGARCVWIVWKVLLTRGVVMCCVCVRGGGVRDIDVRGPIQKACAVGLRSWSKVVKGSTALRINMIRSSNDATAKVRVATRMY
jgi:hypothetical protein